MAALVVTVIAVLAAGAPSVALAVRDLSESQRLVRLTQLNTSAMALSHSLADERDDMTAYVAAGRSTASGHGVSRDERARDDRQAADLERDAGALDTGGSADLAHTAAGLRGALAGLAGIRQAALTGHGSAQAVFDSYTPAIDALDNVSGALARALPARAADQDTSAGPELAEVVTQASTEHGLLIAALVYQGNSSPLVAEAQLARVREQAAFADFDTAASSAARTQYAQTVTGSDVTSADGYIGRLTAHSYFTDSDGRLSTSAVDTALSARIDRMRAVQSSLAADDTTRLTALRDGDVTALEVRGGLVALCALLALGIGVQTARSVTRPLARLRRYAQDPSGPPPTASRDEFAQVALAFARIAEEMAALREDALGREGERARFDDTTRRSDVAERDELRGQQAALLQQRAALMREKDALVARLGSLQSTVNNTFVNLSLRTLALVERQLSLIEGLENREQDPEELETLFRLDHLATRMRRNSESLLVLAGAETSSGALPKPVPLVDVVRAGISEIERYERVRIAFLPRTHLVGFAADDASHLVAELLENATAFSPPQAHVQISGWLLESGEIMLSVEDQGIGIPQARLGELNRMLSETSPDESHSPAGLGLYVVARLAGRHGVRVELRQQRQGGVAAIVVLPRTLVSVFAEASRPPMESRTAAAPSPGTSRPIRGARSEAVGAGAGPRAGLGSGPATHHAAPPGSRAADTEYPAADTEYARPPAEQGGLGPSRRRHARPEQLSADPSASATPSAAVTRPAAGTPSAADTAPDSALPKRVPRASGLTGEPAARAPKPPVDADALRRRLGGFAQGLREGRRDAEVEATGSVELPLPAPRGEPDPSDSEPSEEARG